MGNLSNLLFVAYLVPGDYSARLRLDHLRAHCAEKSHSDRDPEHFPESGNESFVEGVHYQRFADLSARQF